MLWCHAGKNEIGVTRKGRLDRLGQYPVIHRSEIGPSEELGRCATDDADAAGNTFRRETVIAGHHNQTNTGTVALRDRLSDFDAGWVHHRHEAQERQLLFDRVWCILSHGCWEHPLGNRQHPQPLPRIFILRTENLTPSCLI